MSAGQSLSQVDAGGVSQIVGVTRHNTIHCLKSSAASAFKQVGTLSWSRLPGGLKYISCSPTNICWGVTNNLRIYYSVNSYPLTLSCVILSVLISSLIVTSHHIFYLTDIITNHMQDESLDTCVRECKKGWSWVWWKRVHGKFKWPSLPKVNCYSNLSFLNVFSNCDFWIRFAVWV